MTHRNSLIASLIAFLLFPVASIGQVSTVTFSSTNPADGQGGTTYCTSNGWILTSWGYCGQSISPAFTSNMNSANIRFLAVNTSSSGRTTNYPMSGGNYLLYTEGTGTTAEAMSEFIVRAYGYASFPVDLPSVQIFHEAGVAVDFTFEAGTSYRGSEIGRTTISVPSGVATTVDLSGAGFYGFHTIKIMPSSAIIFGVNSFKFSDTPLPVEWVDFSATPTDNGVNLAWTTQQEINTHSFEVQRKTSGGESFETIGTMKAAGNSQELQQYSFVDFKPATGTHQYRIKQIDIDGNYSFSQIEEIQAEVSISVLPNPTSDFLTIFTPEEGWTGKILNMQGQEVMEIASFEDAIDVSELSTGVYLLHLQNGPQTVVEKIVKN